MIRKALDGSRPPLRGERLTMMELVLSLSKDASRLAVGSHLSMREVG
jgi:hypothetical protein